MIIFKSKKVYTTAIKNAESIPDQKAVRLLDGNTNPNIIKFVNVTGTKFKTGTNIIKAYIKIAVIKKFINKKPIPWLGKDKIRNNGFEKK